MVPVTPIRATVVFKHLYHLHIFTETLQEPNLTAGDPATLRLARIGAIPMMRSKLSGSCFAKNIQKTPSVQHKSGLGPIGIRTMVTTPQCRNWIQPTPDVCTPSINSPSMPAPATKVTAPSARCTRDVPGSWHSFILAQVILPNKNAISHQKKACHAGVPENRLLSKPND